MDIHYICDIFLATYFTIIGIHYTAIAIGLKSRDQQTRIHYGKTGSATWVIRWLFNFFRAAILATCIARLITPSIDQIIGTFELSDLAWLRVVGCGLLMLGLFLISYAHSYMQEQWHSGLFSQQQTILRHGPYRICRHPIFAAVMVAMFGFMLALPSVLSVVSFVVGCICLIKQARAEEDTLSAQSDYREYMQQTRRWPLPF